MIGLEELGWLDGGGEQSPRFMGKGFFGSLKLGGGLGSESRIVDHGV